MVDETIDVAIRASAPRSRIVTCLDVRHPDSPGGPVRVVNDTSDIEVGGETYIATRFEAQLAADVEQQAPTARIVIGNIGRDISNWIEAVGGGAGGTVRIFEVLIGGGGEPEWEIEMDIGAITVDDLVTVTLGFDPLLNRPAVSLRYDPQTAPGLF